MTATSALPLFPLHTVLFPGGPLRLRIFEPRYVDLISRCMREGSGFGVVLIVSGKEAGGPAITAPVGTFARINDFERLEDGLLGISVRGERRFRILASRQQPDLLNVADIEWLECDESAPVPMDCVPLQDALRQLLPKLAEVYGEFAADFDDASWVSNRLAEILPLPVAEKQHCLELTDPVERLEYLRHRTGGG